MKLNPRFPPCNPPLRREPKCIAAGGVRIMTPRVTCSLYFRSEGATVATSTRHFPSGSTPYFFSLRVICSRFHHLFLPGSTPNYFFLRVILKRCHRPGIFWWRHIFFVGGAMMFHGGAFINAILLRWWRHIYIYIFLCAKMFHRYLYIHTQIRLRILLHTQQQRFKFGFTKTLTLPQ